MNKIVSNPLRLDAGEEAFFLRQLEYIKVKQYEVKHKPLRAAEFIPVSSEAPPGADTITIRYYDIVGLAKIIHDYASDFPRVDTYGIEKKFPVKSIGTSFGYSVKEIRRSQLAGLPLDQRRAIAAQRASDELIDKIAWLGDTATGLFGLINYPGISEYTVPAVGNQNGATNSKKWVNKTPDQIIADIAGIINGVVVATNGKEIPDTLIVPTYLYTYLSATRVSSYSDKNILTYIKENFLMLKEISWVNELAGVGAGGTDRFMVYVKDPEHLTLEIPQVFEQFAPQQENMQFSVPCHAETAGVICYYPLSVAFGDGI
jgi:hypothetical protein